MVKHLMKIFGTLSGMMLTMALVATSAAAQISSAAGPAVNLSATLPESITVSVTSGATVNFTLVPGGTATGSTTSTILTSWVLASGRTKVTVWAWVPNGAAALTDGANDNIASSQVTAAATGSGSTGGALNASASGGAGVPSFITPAAATGVQIGTATIANTNRISSTTTTLTWSITMPAAQQLPAATYNGTVNIQAQAQ